MPKGLSVSPIQQPVLGAPEKPGRDRLRANSSSRRAPRAWQSLLSSPMTPMMVAAHDGKREVEAGATESTDMDVWLGMSTVSGEAGFRWVHGWQRGKGTGVGERCLRAEAGCERGGSPVRWEELRMPHGRIACRCG